MMSFLKGRAVLPALLIFACAFITPLPVVADVYFLLDAEVRGVYQDNVIGILSDQQRASLTSGGSDRSLSASSVSAFGRQGPGGSPYVGSSTQHNDDFSLEILAQVGVGTTLTKNTAVFVIGNAEKITYTRFSDFDTTLGGINTGFILGLDQIISFKAQGFARIKKFGDPLRDGSSYGGAVELKQRLASWLALKETYEYEKNRAQEPFFSYAGHQVGAGFGAAFLENWMLNLAYTYLIREYVDPSGFRVTTHTASVAIRKTFSKDWHISAGYAREMNSENESNINASNNIYSIGILYTW